MSEEQTSNDPLSLRLPNIKPVDAAPSTIELQNEISRYSEDDLKAPWLPHLHLGLNEKEILEQNQWLTDRPMRAANKLLKEQFNTRIV